MSSSDAQTNIRLLKKFGTWDQTSANLNKRVPHLGVSGQLLYTTGSASDNSGTIVSTTSGATYIKSGKPKPKIIKVWVREGTRYVWRRIVGQLASILTTNETCMSGTKFNFNNVGLTVHNVLK